MNSGQLIHPLYCTRTGVPLGTLNLTVSGGHLPYLSQWKEQICYHPFFSMEQGPLVNMMRDEWNRLAKDIANESISAAESANLQVGFVALLYSLNSIHQDTGFTILPSLGTVQSNLESLSSLAYWQNYLDSKRFSFPDYHFSRVNGNGNLEGIADYLDACWQRKADYESGMNEVQEKYRAQVAEKAILAIRNSFLKPVGKKLLWQWVVGNLPEKWKPDAQGWMGTLFLGNVASSLMFELDEIELMEEIIVSACPLGNGVMFAVRERIEQIKSGYREHYDHFTIEETGTNFIASFSDALTGTPEPKLSDFDKKSNFFVAHAKWSLANPKKQSEEVNKEINSAKAKLNVSANDL